MSGRRHLEAHLRRSDLPAGTAVVLLVAAAVAPTAREVLLCCVVLLAAAWVGLDAIVTDRTGPRARLVMAIALALLAVLPAFLLAFDHSLWSGPFPGLAGGLLLWTLGIAAIATGSRLAPLIPLPAFVRGPQGPVAGGAQTSVVPAQLRGARPAIALAALVAVSLAGFMVKVGGPINYLHNLNNEAASTYGATYLIWGMSFAKFAAFLLLAENWAAGRRSGRRDLVLAAAALSLLLFVGSRLLIIVALIQLLLLYAALRPIGGRFKAILCATVVVAIIAFVAIGEYRRWENLGHGRSFPTYLTKTGLPDLPRTYVNDYADAVRLSVLARSQVPRHAPYEHGKELLRVLLQPLPSGIRPKVRMSRGLTSVFTSGNHNGNALPVPVEGYIEFGLVGAVVFSLLLGAAVGLVDRLGRAPRDAGWLAATVAAGTGAVIVFRGSLAQGIALATIDVVGFFVTHRLLFRRAVSGRPGAVTAAVSDPGAAQGAAATAAG